MINERLSVRRDVTHQEDEGMAGALRQRRRPQQTLKFFKPTNTQPAGLRSCTLRTIV